MSSSLEKKWQSPLPETSDPVHYESYIIYPQIKKALKKYIFSSLYILFPYEQETSSSKRQQMIFFLLNSVIQSLQLQALLWFSPPSSNSISVLPTFWKILGYSRFDNICVAFDFIPGCLYVSLVTVGVMFLAFWTYFTVSTIRHKETVIIKGIIRKGILMISKIFYIPIMTLLWVAFKYSVMGDLEVKEYGGKSDKLTFTGSAIVVGFMIAVLYVQAWVFWNFCYDIRHSYSESSIYCRSHSVCERLKIYIYTTATALYAFFAADHQQVFRASLGLACLILSWNYLNYQPYYCTYTNAIKITKYISCTSCSLFLILGYLADNEAYPFLLYVIIQPIIIILSFIKVHEYILKDQGNYIQANNIYQFERRLRFILTDPLADKKVVLEAFAECYKKKQYGRNCFLVIWNTCFCFFTLNDYCLTRIKIGTETDRLTNLDEEFQIYKLRKTIISTETLYQEDIDYLDFRLKFERVKKQDMELCGCLIEFIKLINGKSSRKYLFSILIPKIAKLLTKVNKNYLDLIIHYPNSTSLMDYFSGFLSEIMNQKDRAKSLINKKQEILASNSLTKLKRISYFDEENGLMIISGSSNAFAIITYANATIGKILHQPESTIIGNNISTYVPSPFDINHDSHMKKFLIDCSSAEIRLPLGLFLQTQSGFLVECYIQVRCTALESSPFFLVLLKERKTTRGIAIISNQGFIQNHSENFPYLLGLKCPSVKDEHLDQYLNGIKFLHMENSNPIAIRKPKSNLVIIKSFKLIKNKYVNIAYLVNDIEEIIDWKKGKFNQETHYVIGQKIDVANTIDTDIFNDKLDHYNNPTKEPQDIQESNNEVQIINLSDQLIASTIIKRVSLSRNMIKNFEQETDFSSNSMFESVKKIFTIFKYLACISFFIVLGIQAGIVGFIKIKYKIHDYNFLQDLAEAGSQMLDSSFISRQIYLANESPLYLTDDFNAYNSLYSSLKNLTKNLNDHKNHISCPAENILIKPLNLQYIPSTFQYTHNSLLDLLTIYLTYMQEFIAKQDKNALKYMLINGIITSSAFIDSYKSIVSCKKNDISSINDILNILTICSIITVVLSVLIMGFCIFRINRNYKLLWRRFKYVAKGKVTELKRRVIERLIDIHQQIEYEVENEDSTEYKLKEDSELFIYLWRLIVYIAMVVSFYFYVFYYIKIQLDTSISFQFESYIVIYDQRFSSLLLTLWLGEYYQSNSENSIDKLYANNTLIKIPVLNIVSLQNDLIEDQEFFLKEDTKNVLSTGTFNTIFEEDTSRIGGVYGIVNEIISASYELIVDNSTEKYYEFRILIEKYKKSNTMLRDKINKDVQGIYTEKIDDFIIVCSWYLGFAYVFFMVLFNYLIYLHAKKVESIHKLGEFIPTKKNVGKDE
ncbi:hypothetical protein SteCoe_31220 [Stentor coeruleus]|uniref:TmcB/TmcC TPR repeats domain-containing protein n=1 Tax=Stentor coeruleus TaxID=5963 RepID=A0A1R2B1T4_9CILI|nr:hypothetical protein SteCoe_31220 [Stentor coeruleus]